MASVISGSNTSTFGGLVETPAGVGYTYDTTRDAFISPKHYPSWLLDEATCQWAAPVAYPTDGKDYTWNEDTTNWIEVTE